MTDVRAQLLAMFSDEAQEMVQSAARLVMKLEKVVDAQVRRDLCRELHNLKGTAAALGFDHASRLAHLLETLVLKSPPDAPLEPARTDCILAALDAVVGHVRATAKEGAGSEAAQKIREPLAMVEKLIREAGIEPPPPPNVAKEKDFQAAAQNAAPPAPVAAPGAAATQSRAAPAGAPEGGDEGPDEGAGPASVRVSATRLEQVLQGSEELHGLRSRLETRSDEMAQLVRSLEAGLRAVKAQLPRPAYESLAAIRTEAQQIASGILADAQLTESLAQGLGEDIRSLRTMQASRLLDTLERTVRDHAQNVGKQVSLAVEGRNIEVDRHLLDELKAPLVHLVRNAVDHGIETPDERKSLGKDARASLSVRLETQGELLRLVVEDDGRGIDGNAIRARAVEKGLVSEAQARGLGEAALHDLIFTPGFSTAKKLSETSGRGIGLDVVRQIARKLRGNVRLESQQGQGTRFLVEVPLTIASAHLLVLQVAAERFAVPAHVVKGIASIPREEVQVVRGHAYVPDGAFLVPLDRLSALVGMATPSGRYGTRLQIVKLAYGGKVAAFEVSDYHDELELIVKPPPPELRTVRHVGGIAVLGSGDALLVLEPEFLLGAANGETGLPEPTSASGRFTVLVADDSATTRMLHQSALEAEGFQVLTASDGEDALRVLARSPCDAVVADIRMPRMSGLELTRAVRASPRLKSLPMLLCSSENEAEAARSAGADGLLLKTQWEKGVLAQMVRSLLKGRPS